MSDKYYTYFVTCPRGIEPLLFKEINSLNIPRTKETRSGIHIKGTLESGYKICLWSRLANRVLLPLARFEAQTTDALYEGIYERVLWEDHMDADTKIAVDFTADHANTFHSHYAALRVKDAIVDRFRTRTGSRPAVDTEVPDIRINVHMKNNLAQVSLDFGGGSLHRRAYRIEGGPAPLKENLAAAILLRANWPRFAQMGAPLADPLCGSGTLLIEGALMALDRAPGLLRPSFGFLKWKHHDAKLWRQLLAEAKMRAEKARHKKNLQIYGYDGNAEIISQAQSNANRANLGDVVSLRTQDIGKLTAPTNATGLLVTNPPYGERMGKEMDLEKLYRTLGDRLRQHFQGWSAGIFTASPELAKKTGIRARKQYHFFNGPIPCKLLNFEIHERWFMGEMKPGRSLARIKIKPEFEQAAEMFQNRLKKNLRIMGKWAKARGITCYRVYDADMPEYAVAIDLYEGHAHVQEYRPPATVPAEKAKERLAQILSVLPETLNIPHDRIIFKIREKKKRNNQYEKFDSQGRTFEVTENDLRFLINLTGYLDTGLFLDQRLIRERLKRKARAKKTLNLFSYTGAATVYMAAGGAVATTSVDMNRTYLEWAERNLVLNHCHGPEHRLVRADCLEWIDGCKDRYDLIYLDPPTFSNSKRMKTAFDVQRDHGALLTRTLRLLSPGGTLMFCTNRRKFRLDQDAFRSWQVKDMTTSTIPKDFQRNPHIHRAFEFKK